jgi:hypothetical protein
MLDVFQPLTQAISRSLSFASKRDYFCSGQTEYGHRNYVNTLSSNGNQWAWPNPWSKPDGLAGRARRHLENVQVRKAPSSVCSVKFGGLHQLPVLIAATLHGRMILRYSVEACGKGAKSIY